MFTDTWSSQRCDCLGPTSLQEGAGEECVVVDGMRLACLRKLRTPFSFCPRVGEMEKLGRSWLPTEVRGEPACCQGETGLSLQSPPAQLVLPPPGPVRQQDVVVGLEAAGGAIMGLVPRAGLLLPPPGDEVTAEAPQASAFPVEILIPSRTSGVFSSPSG